jgi:hypothetical protein
VKITFQPTYDIIRRMFKSLYHQFQIRSRGNRNRNVGVSEVYPVVFSLCAAWQDLSDGQSSRLFARHSPGRFSWHRTRCWPISKAHETLWLCSRQDEIFEWVCCYADEMDGPTPSINEIAVHFRLNYKTVYYHVMKLIVEGRLRQERGKLIVVGCERIDPSG